MVADHENVSGLHPGVRSIGLFGRSYPAEYFRVTGETCVFYDGHQRQLLEHKLQDDSFPWSNITDGPLAVAFSTDQNLVWLQSPMYDRPIYTFKEEVAYEMFQSQLRGKKFRGDFETSSISARREKSFDSFIKAWQGPVGSIWQTTITIPLGAGEELRHHELPLAWLRLSKHGHTSVKLHFKQKRNSAAKRAFSFATFDSGRSSKSKAKRRDSAAIENPNQHDDCLPEDLPPPDYEKIDRISKAFDHFSIIFRSEPDCARFVSLMDEHAQHKRNSTASSSLPESRHSPKQQTTSSSPNSFGPSLSEPVSFPSTAPSSVMPSGTLGVLPTSARRETEPPLDLPGPLLHGDNHNRAEASSSAMQTDLEIRGSQRRHVLNHLQTDLLRIWMVSEFQKVFDGDPSGLVELALSWVTADKPRLAAITSCIEDLRPFLYNWTEKFVDDLFAKYDHETFFGLSISRRNAPASLPSTGSSVETPVRRKANSSISPKIQDHPHTPGPSTDPGTVVHSLRTANPSDSSSNRDERATAGREMIQETRAEQRQRYWARKSPYTPNTNAVRVQAEHQQNRTFYNRELQGRDEIRLLRIEVGSSRQICVKLEYVRLDSAKPYEALSYWWGQGKQMEQITVDGRPGFQVSKHLWQVLRRLRSRKSPYLLWIDAICVNQASVTEKNHQVPLMKDIYRSARRTIVWISEFQINPYENTQSKPTCLRDHVAEGDDTQDLTLCTDSGLSAYEHSKVDDELRGLLHPFHEDLEKTGSGKVWWKRLWCVQEFHFSQRSPSVYIGPHAIGWKHFTELFGPAEAEHGPLSLFHQLRNEDKRLLHDLLCATGAFKCSDPRDRVYALLSMVEKAMTRIIPDYNSSVLEVFQDVTLYLITESETVDVLLDKRVDRSRSDAFLPGIMPTWIPDFTCLRPLQLTRGIDQYQAGRGSQEIVLEQDDQDEDSASPGILKIKAVYFDHIVSRTQTTDLTEVEQSPSGHLVYNSLQRPGLLIARILRALQYEFQKNLRWENLDRSPCLGRLMFEYLFEERKSVVAEDKIRASPPERSLSRLYKLRCGEDIEYVTAENVRAQDEEFINHHWERKKSFLHNGSVKIQHMVDTSTFPWNEIIASDQSIQRDFLLAIDLENLFSYARSCRKKYYFLGKNLKDHYFLGNDYDQAMRLDILQCKDKAAIRRLDTQFDHEDEDIDIHEYSPKSREKDFFRTSAGFMGLGPATLQKGDDIVVPVGASRPFILRRCETGGPGEAPFTLVGECVLPGIMHGQWVTPRLSEARYYKLR